jgi:hypothetical protein
MIERGNAIYNRAEADFQRPLWQWTSDNFEAELDRLAENPLNHVRYAPLLILIPSIKGCYAASQRLTQQRDAALVALALELYHRRHDAWPERLDQLVPDLLPSIPPDRFTGQPLGYRVVNGRPRIYSFGPDKEDNGGQGPTEPGVKADESIYRKTFGSGAKPVESDFGWDWVLWPREPVSFEAEK